MPLSLTLDTEHVGRAATEDLIYWRRLLQMCQHEGAQRMGGQWLKNAKVGLPLIAAELQRRARSCRMTLDAVPPTKPTDRACGYCGYPYLAPAAVCPVCGLPCV
jgi:hypothetical protein